MSMRDAACTGPANATVVYPGTVPYGTGTYIWLTGSRSDALRRRIIAGMSSGGHGIGTVHFQYRYVPHVQARNPRTSVTFLISQECWHGPLPQIPRSFSGVSAYRYNARLASSGSGQKFNHISCCHVTCSVHSVGLRTRYRTGTYQVHTATSP
jgi:hypothetical protein